MTPKFISINNLVHCRSY